jgi:hypothetical protein
MWTCQENAADERRTGQRTTAGICVMNSKIAFDGGFAAHGKRPQT